MANKSYYGLSSTSIPFGAADNLSATGGGSSKGYTTGSETFSFNGFYLRIRPHGGTTPANGGLTAGNGGGWILDTSELDGVAIPTGVWSAIVSLKTSDSTITADLYMRFMYVDTAGPTFTTIGDAVLTAQTITTSGAIYTLTSGSISGLTIPTGQRLYCELYVNQLTGGSATNLTSTQLATTSAGVPGASGGFEISVPQPGPTVITGAASSRITLPSAAASFSVGAGASTIALGGSATGQLLYQTPSIPPPVLPLISAGKPAFASNISFAPSRAVNATYADAWRSVDIPSVGAPIWLAVDLSTVPSLQRGLLVVNLLNEIGNLYYNGADTSQATGLFADYKLQGNAAAGGAGSAPSAGWVDLVTVSGNLYPTRQHIIDFTGYNWLRMICTASNGAVSNQDCIVQLDIHDGHLGLGDRWLMLGDSITLEGMQHGMLGGGDWGYGGAVSQVANAATYGSYYPAMIDGGNGGENIVWAHTNIAGLLNGFTGGFVSFGFGTNDANQNFLYTPGDSNCTSYYAHLLACIDAALALHNVVIVPYIPWGSANGGDLGANAKTLNDYVDAHLGVDRPTVLRGPNFWSFFNTHQSLIRDGIHPTFVEAGGARSGYEEQHNTWATWMNANVYLVSARVGTATLSDSATATASVSDSPGT